MGHPGNIQERPGVCAVWGSRAGRQDSPAVFGGQSRVLAHVSSLGVIIPPQSPAPPFQGLGRGSGTLSLGSELEIKASEPFRGQEVSLEHTWRGHPLSRDNEELKGNVLLKHYLLAG